MTTTTKDIALLEGIKPLELFATCGRCIEYRQDEPVSEIADLRWDGEKWCCEECWDQEGSLAWNDALPALETLPSLARAEKAEAEVELLNRQMIKLSMAAGVRAGRIDDLARLLTARETALEMVRKALQHESPDAVFKSGQRIGTLLAIIDGAMAEPAPTLSRNQPCGCVICSCEDDAQCHGCGAQMCEDHRSGKLCRARYHREGASAEAQVEPQPLPFCPCICHHQKGITHIVPCCDQPPLDPFAPTSALPGLAALTSVRATDGESGE